MVDISNRKKIRPRDIFYYRQRQKNVVFAKIASFFEEEARRRGITKKDVADMLEKDPAQITRWLSSPSNITLDTISDILLSLDALMTFEVQRFTEVAKPNYTHPLVEKSDESIATAKASRPRAKVREGNKMPVKDGSEPKTNITKKFVFEMAEA